MKRSLACAVARRFGYLALLCALCGGTGAADAGEASGSAKYRRAVQLYENKHNFSAKIFGGRQAPYKQNPWQVALVPKHIPDNMYSFCGGVIVAATWVATAAHCVKGNEAHQLQIFTGADRLDTPAAGVRIDVHDIKIHDQFNETTLQYDVALLEVKIDLRASAIALIDDDLATQHALPGRPVWITGWGNIYDWGVKSRTLMGVDVPIVSQDDCKAPDAHSKNVFDDMLCAGLAKGGKDACEADSGGPATILIDGRRYLVGLISWGHPSGCGLPKKYGVYARIVPSRKWILEYTQAR